MTGFTTPLGPEAILTKQQSRRGYSTQAGVWNCDRKWHPDYFHMAQFLFRTTTVQRTTFEEHAYRSNSEKNCKYTLSELSPPQPVYIVGKVYES
jgi:hypothetical protein